ncbi:unnamed protein product [Microthlaspi erraticum]|uniref:Pectinesterase inhibitor domain-containing protein n=1 Tax=Microthlaspi erraticum TaxID=1685480 RepID=A0A6D2IIN0_9BRAS|nr:unnamed protein product [Microthlaspi erraticum]
MAFSWVTRNVFPIIPLLIVLLSITPLSSSIAPSSSHFSPSDKVTKALVDQLCSQPSIYKHFCIAWLNSDPKTFTLDLRGLVGMVIQKTESLSYKNLEMIKDLARTTNDPDLAHSYESCVTYYQLSIRSIKGADSFASSGHYREASNAAFNAFNSISTCEGLLEGKRTPPYVYPRNYMFERMCNIDDIFANLLAL